MRKMITSFLFIGFVLLNSSVYAESQVSNVTTEARLLSQDSEFIAQAQQEALILQTEDSMSLEQQLLASGSVAVLPAAAFTSDGQNPALFFSFATGMMTGVGSTCIKARLFLRHGISIDSVFATVRDNNAGSDLLFTLFRVHNYNGSTPANLATLISSGQSSNLVVLADTSVSSPTVDNLNYSYYIAGCISQADLGILSFRVYYDVFIFNDGFESGNTSNWSNASL